MPRKFSITKKREWLEAYERGTPETAIAGTDHCDVRTIKKGIDEARRERDASLARADLLKEALRKHNESLIDMVRKMLPTLTVPPVSQPIPWEEEPLHGFIIINGGKAQYETWPEIKVLDITLDVESGRVWELLQEHIKRDPFGDAVNRWKRAISSHLEARMATKIKLADLLQARTGYELAEKRTDTPFLDLNSVTFLFQSVIEGLLGQVDAHKLEDEIVADVSKAKVKFSGGGTVAYAPAREEQCRKDIINALKAVKESAEAKNAIDTFKTVERLATKANRSGEEICLLGILPGQCQICRRLGM